MLASCGCFPDICSWLAAGAYRRDPWLRWSPLNLRSCLHGLARGCFREEEAAVSPGAPRPEQGAGESAGVASPGDAGSAQAHLSPLPHPPSCSFA